VLTVLAVVAGALPFSGYVCLDSLDAPDVEGASEVSQHEDVPDAPLPNRPGDITAAQMKDIAFIAEERGITLEEAIAEIGWQESFAQLATVIANEFPEEYAGARIEQDGLPWIAFKGDVPPGAMTMLDGFERGVFSRSEYQLASGEERRVLVREGRGFTEAELAEQVVEAYFAVLDQRDLVADASAGYDIETGEVTVLVEWVNPKTADIRVAMVTELRNRSPHLDGVDLEMVKSVGTGDDASIYGGDAMSGCTSGFTVRTSSTRGIATAAHCSDVQYMYEWLHFVNAHHGTWGDVQWHTSTSYEYDDFWSGNSQDYDVNLRDVNARGNAVEGQSLCRNGKTTYKECDTVYQLNHCSSGVCHLTAMHNDEASGGDSGGPWFYGNTAYGIHQGYKWWWFKSRDLFTPQQYIDDGMPGVTVATT